jgi:hypothetical protein
MKQTLLKLSSLVLAFSTLSIAHADDSSVIPTTTPGFTVSLTGLYLEPNASNLNYAVYTTPLPVPAPNWQQEYINPGYGPSFALGIQYTLADATDQLDLDWLHVNTNNSASVGSNGAGTSVAPPYYFGPLAQLLVDSAASSTANFNVDNVNLDFGHLINVSNNIQIKPFIGVSVAYLKEDINSTYTGKDATSSHYAYSINTDTSSTFTGAGPRIGLDGTYFITNRFGITAEMATSLLLGSIDSSTTFNAYDANPSTGNNPAVNTTLANQSQTKIIPEVDAKIAAEYSIPFNTNGSSLTLAAGYMLEDYINGINQILPTALVPGALNGGTIAIESSTNQESDLSLNGPFASLAWKF